jgi:hypothetical protein
MGFLSAEKNKVNFFLKIILERLQKGKNRFIFAPASEEKYIDLKVFSFFFLNNLQDKKMLITFAPALNEKRLKN